jgi:AcrR family transcriptional regulator
MARKLKTQRRPEIVDAALAIADEQGLDAVSMRAVAERIGLTPMALYGYFSSKDALLDAVTGRLVSEFAVPYAGTDWRDRLSAMAHAVRDVARRHPSVFPLMFARPSITPDAVRVVDMVYQALLDAGVPPQHVPRVERLVSTFVLGFAASEVSGRFSASSDDKRARRGHLTPEDAPAHHLLAPHLDDPDDLDAEFIADLEDLEAAITAAAARADLGSA